MSTNVEPTIYVYTIRYPDTHMASLYIKKTFWRDKWIYKPQFAEPMNKTLAPFDMQQFLFWREIG